MSFCFILSTMVPTVQADEKEEFAKNLIVKVSGKKSFGTGIIVGLIGDNILIATAYHILGMEKEFELEFRFVQLLQIPAEVVKINREMDVAILRAKMPSHFPKEKIPLDKVECAKAKEKQSVRVVGHPGGNLWDSSLSTVKVKDINKRTGEIMFDFQCKPGHSGGGLFTDDWRIVGMILRQDMACCDARSIEILLEMVPDEWDKLKCDLQTLLSKLQKLAEKYTELKIGCITSMTGPLAGYSEIYSINHYIKYLNSRGGIYGKKIKLIVMDCSFKMPNTIRAVKQLKAQECTLIILDSSTQYQSKIVEIVIKNNMLAYLVKRGELFD